MTTESMIMGLICWGLTTLIAAFGGSYFAGYLKKKGENLATHEDMNRLVDQVRAVTTATKEIEARISNEVLENQREWTLRKELILEALKELGSAETALVNCFTAEQTLRRSSPELELYSRQHWAKTSDTYTQAFDGFNRAKMLVEVVCDAELARIFNSLSLMMAQMRKAISSNPIPDLKDWYSPLAAATNALTVSVKKNLVANAETSQSSNITSRSKTSA